MYQIETVPVPILDENEQAHLYTELKIEKTVYCFKWRNVYNIVYSRIENV